MAAELNARVLADFLDYLRIEKGLAPLTISAYATDLNQFAQFLEKRKRAFLAARRNDVREFLQQLFSNGVDGRSVGRKLSALRHLYRVHLVCSPRNRGYFWRGLRSIFRVGKPARIEKVLGRGAAPRAILLK